MSQRRRFSMQGWRRSEKFAFWGGLTKYAFGFFAVLTIAGGWQAKALAAGVVVAAALDLLTHVDAVNERLRIAQAPAPVPTSGTPPLTKLPPAAPPPA
jgi:hypothetical protein